MLPVMTIPADPHGRVKVTLPDGRRAWVTTRYERARGRIVIVQPLKS
jgi:hypothetical protein